MAIAAEEIRALFAQEAALRLARLGQLLLDLEEQDDAQLVAEIFREVHTLKGSAAVAGLPEVSKQAHGMEEIVDDLRRGVRTASSDVIDALLRGTDELKSAISGDEPTPSEPAATQSAQPSRPAPRAADQPARPAPPPRPDTGSVLVSMERLDELIRLVGESATAHLRVGRMLTERFGVDPASIAEYGELSRSVNELQDRAMRTRMVPIATVTDQLQRAARDLARSQGKQLRWEVRGTETELDRSVLGRLAESLVHVVRNAVDHGIEVPEERRAAGKPDYGTICLHAMQLGSEVIIAISDDGRGVDISDVRRQAGRQGLDADSLTDEEALELIFLGGLSTSRFVTDVSGRGVGLDVVRCNVEAAHGRVEVRSDPAAGSEFRVIVPITLAVLRCLLVEAGGQRFALPFHRVVSSQPYDRAAGMRAEGRPVAIVDGRPIPVSGLAETVGLKESAHAAGPVVILADTGRRHAFRVDQLVGQRDVVLKGLTRLLPHLPAVAGASVEPDGSVLVVLDPPGLIQRARESGRTAAAAAEAPRSTASQRSVLVVDDALTVRELQRGILERAGYEVRVATHGAQALAALDERPADIVLTDVEMPVMDGFALTEAIRSRPALANIPVLILTSLSSEADKKRGLDAGADGYIVKSGFDETSLLAAVDRLLGAPT
ncbi:MAG TPA: response regulator [Jatrophihabitans sp.]|jgi:two-component system chemotaxis sensor kinase CheA|nr:response regulator [Jatrophihabitans sp.]